MHETKIFNRIYFNFSFTGRIEIFFVVLTVTTESKLIQPVIRNVNRNPFEETTVMEK